MGASRATWTLAFSIVSVGAAIALVHGMQTEERRRLHQVGWDISPTHARTHARVTTTTTDNLVLSCCWGRGLTH